MTHRRNKINSCFLCFYLVISIPAIIFAFLSIDENKNYEESLFKNDTCNILNNYTTSVKCSVAERCFQGNVLIYFEDSKTIQHVTTNNLNLFSWNQSWAQDMMEKYINRITNGKGIIDFDCYVSINNKNSYVFSKSQAEPDNDALEASTLYTELALSILFVVLISSAITSCFNSCCCFPDGNNTPNLSFNNENFLNRIKIYLERIDDYNRVINHNEVVNENITTPQIELEIINQHVSNNSFTGESKE